jgi:integrase
MAELALFERNPRAYVAPNASRLTLDSKRLASFLEHLEARGLAQSYRSDVRRSLLVWQNYFRDRDLRDFEPRDLLHFLEDLPSRRPMIVHLKSLTKWLRDQAELDIAEDPSRLLKAPKAMPEKAVRAKGFTIAAVERLYARIIPQDIRDVVAAGAKTGLHLTELNRLARGQGVIEPITEQGEIAGQLRVWHKNGREHRQSIDAQTLEAILRLRQRGSVPARQWIRKNLHRASEGIGVEPMDFGELRHSFASWAGDQGEIVWPKGRGVPLTLIAQVMGHDAKTNRDFYRTAIEPMIKLPIKLIHPEDPRPAL